MKIDESKFSDVKNITEKSMLKDKYNVKIRTVDYELIEELNSLYPDLNKTDLFNLIMKNYFKDYLSDFDPDNDEVDIPFLIAAVADALSESVAIDVNENWKTVIAERGSYSLTLGDLDAIVRTRSLKQIVWDNLGNTATFPNGAFPDEECISVCLKILVFFDEIKLDKNSWLYKKIKMYADMQNRR